jgi:Ca2+-binding EF-hand superfamily protein
MKRSLALMLGLATLCSAPAWAGQGKGPKSFESLDANGDKALSKEEVNNARRLSSQFDSIDSDKNGSISMEELQSFRAQKRAACMNK